MHTSILLGYTEAGRRRLHGFGRWSRPGAEGVIQFRHFVDVEGVEPSVTMIGNMFGSACSAFNNWFDELAEVALAGTKAQAVIDRLTSDAGK